MLLPTALAAWWRCPNHLRIKPYRQRSTLLQAVIVRRPILGLVLRRGPTAHSNQLSRWIQTVNPISTFMQQGHCWIPKYKPLAIEGLWRTIWIMTVTTVLGFLLAIPLGLAHAVEPWYLSAPSRIFCTVIPGTPLLLQIWLLYYGLGSLFP